MHQHMQVGRAVGVLAVAHLKLAHGAQTRMVGELMQHNDFALASARVRAVVEPSSALAHSCCSRTTAVQNLHVPSRPACVRAQLPKRHTLLQPFQSTVVHS